MSGLTRSFVRPPIARRCSPASSKGWGPRYCPSVEDKIVRFADKSSHQIFVEPEGLNTHEIYPNGISTSLPFDVQYEFVRTIQGFENAHLTRPGYAIEYDYFDPRDLRPSLETRVIGGLFFAGQINGTTGYERGRRAGPRGGHQRNLGAARPRGVDAETQRGLYRRSHRRPCQPWDERALSDVHEPCRAPAAAA